MSELKLRLEFEDNPEDISAAKGEMFRECRSLVDYVNDHTDASATIPEISTQRNVRGMEIAIGTIILTAFAGEAVKGLLQFIKHRIESKFPKYNYIIIILKSGKILVKVKSSNFIDLEISKLITEIEDC
jgi:hypothetical protein